MDQDSAHMVAASKVPMLKPGEYELWKMRMELYIQMINYSLWEVIEMINSIKDPSHCYKSVRTGLREAATKNDLRGILYSSSTQATAVNSTTIGK
ncbi:hypothetical protein Tco_1203040 [Tanacetum coccineum]